MEGQWKKNHGCKNKCREIHRLIDGRDFAIVGFCRVRVLKCFPEAAVGESL